MKSTIEEIYLPSKGEIIDIINMTPEIKLFKIKPKKQFHYHPGEFIMLSLCGKGEVPISLTSTFGFHKHIELCIRRVGHITTAISELRPHSEIGIRGPLGNMFPIENARGQDVLFVAGGLGIAPLRPLINKVVNEKKHFKRVVLIYGSRNPSEILFKDEMDSWEKKGVRLILTVEKKDKRWQGKVGRVTEYPKISKISFMNAYAFICGPPVMINVTMQSLSMMGMHEDNIFTSLEAHMKCGVGKCGHCYIGSKYICTNGPIFSYAEIKNDALRTSHKS